MNGFVKGLCIYHVILLNFIMAYSVPRLSPAELLSRSLFHVWWQEPEARFGGGMRPAPRMKRSMSGMACLSNGGDVTSSGDAGGELSWRGGL